eukprot:900395-Amphidinium_carterae.1
MNNNTPPTTNNKQQTTTCPSNSNRNTSPRSAEVLLKSYCECFLNTMECAPMSMCAQTQWDKGLVMT